MPAGAGRNKTEFAVGTRAEQGISVPLPKGSTAGTAPQLGKARALPTGILETPGRGCLTRRTSG